MKTLPWKRLGQGAVFKTGANAVQIAVGLAIAVALNRVYGKDAYGLLVLVYAVTALALVLSDFGAKITLIRFVPLLIQQRGEDAAARLFAVALVLQILGIGLTGAVLVGASRLIAEELFRSSEFVDFVRLGAVYLAGFALLEFFTQTFQALQDWRHEAMVNVTFALFQAIGLGVVVSLPGSAITWMLASNALAAGIAGALAFAWLPATFRRALPRLERRDVIEELPRILRFGVPLIPQGIYRYGISWFDKILLGRFGPPATLAVYYVGVSFVNGLVMLFKVIPTILAPYMAELSAGDTAALRRKFPIVFRALFYAALGASTVMFFAVEPAVQLMFGAGYEDVVPLARGLLVVFMLRACRDPFTLFILNAFGQVRTTFALGTILGLATVLSAAVLVPWFGPWGAIWSAVIGNVATWIAMLLMVPSLRVLVPVRVLAESAVLLGPVVGFYWYWNSSLGSVVKTGVVVAYVVAVAAVCAMRTVRRPLVA